MYSTLISKILETGNSLIEAQKNFSNDQIHLKGHANFVTNYDVSTEKEIIKYISSIDAKANFLAEESSNDFNLEKISSQEKLWVIDPIDGTANFIYGYPSFGISVGLLEYGVPTFGIIYNSTDRSVIYAYKDKGCFHFDGTNTTQCFINDKTDIKVSLIQYGGWECFNEPAVNIYPSKLKLLTGGIRNQGCATADFYHLATGKVDGMVMVRNQIWDVAAGGLLVKEAGALISDLDGNDKWLSGSVIASNEHLFHDLQDIIIND